MTKYGRSLVLMSALALAGTWACSSPAGRGGSTGGSGGEEETGGSPGTGGSKATGGKTGSTGGTTGTGGSTGGSPGTGGSTTTGGSTGTGGSTTTGGSGVDAGPDGPPSSGGKMMITVDSDPKTSTPDRLCFKPEACANQGDHSPKIDWTPPPAGTMSLTLMMEDLSNTPTPHQIVCNMMPTETGRPADVMAMIPAGALKITGHGKPMDRWYGPGAGVRNYEITIFALATPTFPMACLDAKKTRDYLKANKNNKAVILDYASQVLWGSASGACK